MNPWSFYEHKPQLVQAGLAVAVAAWVLARGRLARGSPGWVVVLAALVWALLGATDYLLYAFSRRPDTLVELSRMLEWIRAGAVAIAAIASIQHMSQRTSVR